MSVEWVTTCSTTKRTSWDEPMSQIGEAVKYAKIDAAIRKCPFQEPETDDVKDPEDEDFSEDDSVAMRAAQANSGSKLGTNVKAGSLGTERIWNTLGGDSPRYKKEQVDTGRKGVKVKVRGRNYPYTVAAHHLIPGTAS